MKRLKVVIRRIIALSLVMAVAFGFVPVFPGQEPVEVEAYSPTAERMIAAAEEFVGNSREEIKDIIYSHGRTPYLAYWTDDWCAWFVTNSARMGDVPTELIWNTHRADRSFYQDKGWYHEGHAFGGTYVPKRGDLMFFDYEGDNYCDHIGIVTGSDGETVYSLEGNLDGIARRRERDIYNSDIRGYAEIHYYDEIKQFTIAFHPNGGKGAMSGHTVTYGTSTKLRKNTYTRIGYKFIGWIAERRSDKHRLYKDGWYRPGTQPAGSEYQYYSDQATVAQTSDKDGDVVTMYAAWKAMPAYTIKYDANGGTGAPADQSKPYNGTIQLSYTKPTREGYSFIGWSESKNSSAVVNYPGSTYKANQSCKYYAVWRKTDTATTGVLMERLFGKDRIDTSFYTLSVMRKKLSKKSFDSLVIASSMDYPDALSGVYLAKVKNAPILLAPTKNPEKFVGWIKEYVNEGSTIYLLGGEKVLPNSIKNGLGKYNFVRLGGKTRYETNLKILNAAGVKGGDILVCSGNGYADSLSAAASGKPIMIVDKALTSAQKEFLKQSGVAKATIIGGNKAVSTAIQNELKKYCSIVSRIGGKSRYETSVLVAKRLVKSNPDSVILAYGNNFPDGLAAGPLALTMEAPILLVDNSSQNYQYAKQYVQEKGIKHSITIGGIGLVSNATTREVMNGKGNVNYIW